MAGMSALFVLPFALITASPPTFQAALNDAQARQRPLLVLVGADWCPGCRTMKHSILPGLARRGALRTVSYATIDTETEGTIARQLMRGSSIPQLIALSPTSDGKWRREQITGEASEAEVQSLIARALKVQRRPIAATSSAIGN
jgi:thioredoxin-like negative regulator of GroEL